MKDNNTRRWSVGCRLMMWCYNTQQHRTVGDVPYRLVFGQHPRVGISGFHLEQDLLDRLATEADLNRVVEYEGMIEVLDDNDPNEGMIDASVPETEEGVTEQEEVNAVLEIPVDQLAMVVAEQGVPTTEERVAAMVVAEQGVPTTQEGVASIATQEGVASVVVVEQGVPTTKKGVAEQVVPTTPCGQKTTGDVGFTKWQVMVSDLGDTIIDHNYLKSMRIRQSIPVVRCVDTTNVLDTQSFVAAILVKISNQTWELMDENDDDME